MQYWVLTSQGTVISQESVQRITHLETQTADNKERFCLFELSEEKLVVTYRVPIRTERPSFSESGNNRSRVPVIKIQN